MVFERSSATMRAPRGSTLTPTGRPRVFPSAPLKPETKSTGGPAGRPPRNGTKTTLYPTGWLRFQLPCSPTNTPSANRAPIAGVEKDRKSVVEGKSEAVRVDLGGRRIIKKKNQAIH